MLSLNSFFNSALNTCVYLTEQSFIIDWLETLSLYESENPGVCCAAYNDMDSVFLLMKK